MSKIYGVGINDLSNESLVNGKMTPAYEAWRGMMRRCYSQSEINKYPTYKDCFVCEEWFIFSEFKKWFDLNYKDGFHLDKDILHIGNKEYCPDKCSFVPRYINNLLTLRSRDRGRYPLGVSFHKHTQKYIAEISIQSKSMHIGIYDTPEEASKAYMVYKENHVKKIAKEAYDKGDIDSSLLEALFSWRIPNGI